MPPNIGFVNQNGFSQRTLKASGRGEIQFRRVFVFVFSTSRRTQKGQWVEVATWESQVSDDGKSPLDSFPVDSL